MQVGQTNTYKSRYEAGGTGGNSQERLISHRTSLIKPGDTLATRQMHVTGNMRLSCAFCCWPPATNASPTSRLLFNSCRDDAMAKDEETLSYEYTSSCVLQGFDRGCRQPISWVWLPCLASASQPGCGQRMMHNVHINPYHKAILEQ